MAYGTGEREVFDLRNDPDELTNLRDRVDPAWLTRLFRMARALGSCAGATPAARGAAGAGAAAVQLTGVFLPKVSVPHYNRGRDTVLR